MNRYSFFLYTFSLVALCRCTGYKKNLDPPYEAIRTYYTQNTFQETEQAGQDKICGPIRFLSESDTFLLPGKRLKQIMLLRHARPLVDKSGYYNFYEASNYLEAYDHAGVADTNARPVCTSPAEVPQIYCSPLNRSRQTARMVFGPNYRIVMHPIFREFERKIVPVPVFTKKLKFWLISSRVLWIMGQNDFGIESFKEAKLRTQKAAQILIEHAERDQKVILVAHGFLNRFLAKELQNRGWQWVRNGGNDYLSVQVLVKYE